MSVNRIFHKFSSLDHLKVLFMAILVGIIITTPVLSYGDAYITTYIDAEQNTWNILAKKKPGYTFDFKNPKTTCSGITIYKNDTLITPDLEKKFVLLEAISRYYENRTIPQIDLNLGDMWDESMKIWRKDCGLTEWACGASLIGFDRNKRFNIYKELIWDAVTSKNYPFLITHAYYKARTGDSCIANALPTNLYKGINNLYSIIYEDEGDKILKFADITTKIFKLANTEQIESIITKLVSENQFKIDSNSLESVDTLIDLVKAVKILSQGSLSFIKNLYLLELVSAAHIAKDRLEVLKKAYIYMNNIEEIDGQILLAIDSVENQLVTDYSALKQAFIQAYKETSEDIAAFAYELAKSKIGKKILQESFKSAGLSTKVANAQASAVLSAIDLKDAITATILDTTATWRRIHLIAMLGNMLSKYRYSQDFDDSVSVLAQSPDSISNPTANNVYDMLSVVSMDYINYGISLIDSNWLNLSAEALKATINTVKYPQLYAVYFSTTAYNFGSEMGKGLNKLVYSDALEDIFSTYDVIKDTAIQRGVAFTEYSELIKDDGLPKPMSSILSLLLTDDKPRDSVEQGLIAYWTFEGDALDQVGNHHGTLYGDTSFVSGKIGQAASFDGSGDYIQVSPNFLQELDNFPLTWAMWIQANALPNFPPASNTPVITSDVHCKPVRFTFTNYSAVGFGANSGCFQGKGIVANLNLNEWYHVAGTIDDIQIKLYVNGQLADSVPFDYTDIATLNGSFKIGGNNRISRYFTGLLDDVRIYNRALTEVEIQELSNHSDDINEIEPNNTLATAQNIDNHFTLGYNEDIADSTTIPWVSIKGTGDGTFDYYKFYSPGSTIGTKFDIDYGYQPGDSGSFDSFTAIWDSSGICLYCDHGGSSSAGAGGSTHNEDSYNGYIITEPGWYIIGVSQDGSGIVCPNDKSDLNGGFAGPLSPVPSGATYELQVSIPGHSVDYDTNFCGTWSETDGDYGTFCMSLNISESTFNGKYDATKLTNEGGSDTYLISGIRVGNDYEGTDSRGRQFTLELSNNYSFISGSYFDPDGGETGTLISP